MSIFLKSIKNNQGTNQVNFFDPSKLTRALRCPLAAKYSHSMLMILHFITLKFLYPSSLSSLVKSKLSNLPFSPEVGLSETVPGPLVTR